MLDDRSLSFAATDTWPDGRGGRLCNHIEQAQSHIVSRSRARKWIERLKVLIPAPSPSCDYDYVLVLRSEQHDRRYVAVSYCWRTSGKTTDSTLLSRVRILQGEIIRPARARPEVVRRAFRYAHSIGIGGVWIDQECIEQDDRVDKEDGIQSMDLVYRNAYRALGLLEGCNIDSEADVAMLCELMSNSYKQSGQFAQYVCIDSPLFQKLLKDPWFTRAWINQEYLCASNVVLILPWMIDIANCKWNAMKELSDDLAQNQKLSIINIFPLSDQIIPIPQISNLRLAPSRYLIEELKHLHRRISNTFFIICRPAKAKHIQNSGRLCLPVLSG